VVTLAHMTDRKKMLREALEKTLSEVVSNPRRCPVRIDPATLRRGKAATQRRSTRLH
jgi:hypothetical protein